MGGEASQLLLITDHLIRKVQNYGTWVAVNELVLASWAVRRYDMIIKNSFQHKRPLGQKKYTFLNGDNSNVGKYFTSTSLRC